MVNLCREVCSEVLEKENSKVDGPEKIVETDESKFGKRKYHKGRRKGGVWVFGIEKDSKNCFLASVENRSADTLIPIIKKHVLLGTTIISDCWKAYSRLEEEGYTHMTVNHSKEFVNSQTGAYTSTLESTLRAIKTSLPKHGTVKSLYDTYFGKKTSKQLSWSLSNFLGVCLDSLHSRKHEETKPRPWTCGEKEEGYRRVVNRTEEIGFRPIN